MKGMLKNQETTCLAFFSQAGIACASDTDGTIRLLSKTRPFAAALDPRSPIPWEVICNDYFRERAELPVGSLKSYADDFMAFIDQNGYRAEKKHKGSSSEAVFMGYGHSDLYPSVVYGIMSVGSDGRPLFTVKSEISVSNIGGNAFYYGLGSFDTILPIIEGVSEDMKTKTIAFQHQLLNDFRKEITEKVIGTPGEDAIMKALDNVDFESSAIHICESASDNIAKDISVGIDSFSIEEMIDSVETLVDAQVRLTHLRDGNSSAMGYTREIAVMTIPEGLTWIKHPLFAR